MCLPFVHYFAIHVHLLYLAFDFAKQNVFYEIFKIFLDNELS